MNCGIKSQNTWVAPVAPALNGMVSVGNDEWRRLWRAVAPSLKADVDQCNPVWGNWRGTLDYAPSLKAKVKCETEGTLGCAPALKANVVERCDTQETCCDALCCAPSLKAIVVKRDMCG